MPAYDYLKLLQSDTANTVAAVTTDKVNFGDANPAPNKGGVPYGLHAIVTTTFTDLTEGVLLIQPRTTSRPPVRFIHRCSCR